MITLISAMSLNRGIGFENRLPWRLPAEMAYFKKNTLGKTVVMGRKTFESLPKPLVDRVNVVLTHNEAYAPEGCEVVHSIDAALAYGSEGELMVIGGEQIYEAFLPYADRVLLTEVDVVLEQVDAFFPVLTEEAWQLVARNEHERDERNAYNYATCEYRRRA